MTGISPLIDPRRGADARLDPDITPANAALQAKRVAQARGATPEQIKALFGQLLELYRALEKAFPR